MRTKILLALLAITAAYPERAQSEPIRYPTMIAVSEDGATFALGGMEKAAIRYAVGAYNRANGKQTFYKEYSQGISSIHLNHDGSRLMISLTGATAVEWADTRSGQVLCSLPSDDGLNRGLLAPDGKTAMIANEHWLQIADLEACEMRSELKRRWNRDEADEANKPSIFSFFPTRITARQELTILSFAHKGPEWDQQVVRMSLRAPAPSSSVARFPERIMEMRSRVFASRPESSQLWAINLYVGSEGLSYYRLMAIDEQTGAPLKSFPLESLAEAPAAIHFSPDGKRLLVATGWDIAVYDPESGAQLWEVKRAGCALFQSDRCLNSDAMIASFVPGTDQVLVAGDAGFGYLNPTLNRSLK